VRSKLNKDGKPCDHWRKYPHHLRKSQGALSNKTLILPGAGGQAAEAGAWALDLNLGPRKKTGRSLPWIVRTFEAVVDLPLSFDSTTCKASKPA